MPSARLERRAWRGPVFRRARRRGDRRRNVHRHGPPQRRRHRKGSQVNESLWAFNTLVAAAAVGLLGAGCGLVGTFTLLRRRALVGDVVAHCALPGLCLAFIVVGTRSLPALLLGAFLTGVLGVATATFLSRTTRLKEDAILGAVLSVYFGFGAVLDSLIQG